MSVCPLAQEIKPEWDYTDVLLPESEVFKQYPDDDQYLCMQKKDITAFFQELLRCDYARKSLLSLIKVADKK